MVTLLWIAALGQLGAVLVALGLPKVLRWKEELRTLRPMNRQLFWVYGVFITMNNIAFAALTLLWAPDIAAADGLAHGFAGFVAAYWATRTAVQLFVFDRSDWPKGPKYEAAHWTFTALFAFLVGVYGSAFVGGLL